MDADSRNGGPEPLQFTRALAAFAAEPEPVAHIAGGWDGRVHYASPLTLARLGCTVQALQGRSLADIVPTDERGAVRALFERGRSAESLRLSLVDASGGEWPLVCRLAFAGEGFLLLGRTAAPTAPGLEDAARTDLVARAREDERRRIARDLHDSAQQQLLAVAIELSLEAERAEDEDAGLHDRLLTARDQVDQALQAIRELAEGVYPSLLATGGLEEALSAATVRLSLPVLIRCRAGRYTPRYTPEIEKAVYFSCLEGVQNAVKHARCKQVTIDLSERHGLLRFHVHDDGRGFDPTEPTTGTGLASIADRLAAVGGRSEVHSQPGRGTTLSGTIPLEDQPSRPPSQAGDRATSAQARPSGTAASPARAG